MSYDLTLFSPKSTPIPQDALRAFVEGRRYWEWSDGSASFDHPPSGGQFSLYITDDGSLSLSASGGAAHHFGPKLVSQVRALVDHFGLEVDDPQMEGMGRGPLDEDKLLAGFRFYLGFVTKSNHTLFGREIPPHGAAALLERVAAWNEALPGFEGDDSLFTPTIQYAVGDDGVVAPFVAWVDGPGRLPVVDSIVTPLRRVRFAVLEEVMARVPLVAEPAPHYLVDEELAPAVAAAIAAASETLPMPKVAPSHVVRTTEILEPYLHGLDGLDADTLSQMAFMAHQSNDSERAFDTGSRAVKLDPTSVNAALIAGIHGTYLSRFDEALHCIDAALAVDPENDTANLVRGVILTDLARYDEALAALDRSIAADPSAMAINCKAFTLAAAGREAEAKAEYERALQLLDAELVENPEDGDTISRRAYALLGLGRAKEALAEGKRAKKLVGDPFLTLQSLGRAQVMLGAYKAAVAPLTEALKGRKSAPLASYYLALAQAQLDRPEKARAALVDARRSKHFAALAARDPLLAKL